MLLPQMPLPGGPPPALRSPGAEALDVADPVQIIDLQDGVWPAMFAWRGRRVTVTAVIGHATETRHTFRGPVTDHHFAVVTDAGHFRLCYTQQADRWSATSIGGTR